MYALYSDRYVIDLPPNHSFPIQKYRLIRERLLAEGTLRQDELLEPTLADPKDIRRVHTEEYWANLTEGTLPAGSGFGLSAAALLSNARNLLSSVPISPFT
jgi:acetoin utilization deacetylase AcuC-like enzyme